MKARNLAKRLTGRVIESVTGAQSFENCIFILAHMRCGSTALSNIICSRPDVNGYGETHVRHDDPGSPARLALNQMRRGSWSRQAPFLFDKLLHNRLDSAAPPEFFSARAIFMLREPEPAIASICHLYQQTGRRQFRNPDAAARYYGYRVGALSQLWDLFPAERRIGMTHKGLMHDPDLALSCISHHLAFAPPLANEYVSKAASRMGGGGDPLVSGSLQRIEPALLKPSRPLAALGLPQETNRRLESLYVELRDRMAGDWPDLAI